MIAEIHRAQAHSLAVRARAEMRLAEEYDAAQDRGEISKQGAHFSEGKLRSSEILAPKELHEARDLRDAERDDPGIIGRRHDEIHDARGRELAEKRARGEGLRSRTADSAVEVV